jgi:hypothetical protein
MQCQLADVGVVTQLVAHRCNVIVCQYVAYSDATLSDRYKPLLHTRPHTHVQCKLTSLNRHTPRRFCLRINSRKLVLLEYKASFMSRACVCGARVGCAKSFADNEFILACWVMSLFRTVANCLHSQRVRQTFA